MQEETKNWLNYSQENFDAAKVLLDSQLYNPCLHNIQQSVEKALKSLFIEKSIPFKKTHNIMELKNTLAEYSLDAGLSDDDCDFLDSIYLPSKYPVGSALPFFYPDETICKDLIVLAEKVLDQVNILLRN